MKVPKKERYPLIFWDDKHGYFPVTSCLRSVIVGCPVFLTQLAWYAFRIWWRNNKNSVLSAFRCNIPHWSGSNVVPATSSYLYISVQSSFDNQFVFSGYCIQSKRYKIGCATEEIYGLFQCQVWQLAVPFCTLLGWGSCWNLEVRSGQWQRRR